MESVKKYKIISLIFFLLLLTLIIWIFLFKEEERMIKEIETSDYDFINKTVVYDLGKHYIINFSPLKESLLLIQKKYDFKNYIYFNYLNNGSWIGLNEKEDFVAASLVKVPLSMGVLKAVEEGRLSLDQSYTLEELDLDSNFGDLYKEGSGSIFSIEELLGIMLKESDNTARGALFRALERIGINDPLYDVYSSLGWNYIGEINPGSNKNQIIDTNLYSKINLKLLSNMFLALYNSSYLDLKYSDKILEYLANTPFNDKIRAGVPDGVVVSHKIGVAIDNKTFSDCGIVYAPNRNYLLCLGSNGGNEKLASDFMAEVSEVVYDYVINN